MEYDLGGTDHIQPAVSIHITGGAKGFHHSLLVWQRVVSAFHHLIAFLQNRFHIPLPVCFAGTEIPFIICSHRKQGCPVLLRMDQCLIILSLMEIQNRRQHRIIYFNHLQGPVHTGLIPARHNGHRVSHIAHMAVQNQPVIGAGFRIRLPGHGKPLIWHILPGIDSLDTGYLLRIFRFYLFDLCIGMGASKHLHHQIISSGHIIQEHRFSCHQRHGVLFPDRLVHHFCGGTRTLLHFLSDFRSFYTHIPAPPFLYARKA